MTMSSRPILFVCRQSEPAAMRGAHGSMQLPILVTATVA